MKIYLLVVQNTLYVDLISHNLISPSIVCETGLIVNDTCRIHATEDMTDAHTIKDPKSNWVILLQLNGTFSKFETRVTR